MDMGKRPTFPKKTPTETIKENGQKTEKITQMAGYRKSQIKNKMAEQIVHDTKKGVIRRQANCGSFEAEQIYKVPQIQNVNNGTSTTSSTKEFLDSVVGLERRILACPGNPKEKTILRFPLQRSRLAVPSFALRSKRRTMNIHKIKQSFEII